MPRDVAPTNDQSCIFHVGLREMASTLDEYTYVDHRGRLEGCSFWSHDVKKSLGFRWNVISGHSSVFSKLFAICLRWPSAIIFDGREFYLYSAVNDNLLVRSCALGVSYAKYRPWNLVHLLADITAGNHVWGVCPKEVWADTYTSKSKVFYWDRIFKTALTINEQTGSYIVKSFLRKMLTSERTGCYSFCTIKRNNNNNSMSLSSYFIPYTSRASNTGETKKQEIVGWIIESMMHCMHKTKT
jgi:hypothetical protein